MNRMIARVAARFSGQVRDGEAGQGLAEYALILALVALACVVALGALGQGIATSAGFVALPSSL